ncbi:hypothetical protein HYC85_017271 [Camellia sinensis]|uniref:Uncharacterized protein n=1 Tax=Camellia sinensis TaxID=4442 RepID=A0A7J7H244_CAMSI|nr:hypothetical protein HYC85_017271 [Camellia sinensis]
MIWLTLFLQPIEEVENSQPQVKLLLFQHYSARISSIPIFSPPPPSPMFTLEDRSDFSPEFEITDYPMSLESKLGLRILSGDRRW